MRNMEIEVDQNEVGNRIDRMLGRKLYPEYSRSYLSCMIDAGDILVNNRKVRKNYRLGQGDKILLSFSDRVDETPAPEDLPIRIIFEDDHVIIIDKPEGMVIHPGVGATSGTLVNLLLFRYPEIAKVGIAFRPGIVHRLDKDTSGVIVAARSNLARFHLVEEFKNRNVQKEYHAVVIGEVPYDSDYIDLPIAKDPRNREKMRVDRRCGKPASTFYEVIERFNGFTYVKCMPHTGRTHQIRVHLSHLGFPIIADSLYQGNKGQRYWNKLTESKDAGRLYPLIQRQALHARSIKFTHPITKKVTQFSSSLPLDIQQLLEWLKTDQGLKGD